MSEPGTEGVGGAGDGAGEDYYERIVRENRARAEAALQAAKARWGKGSEGLNLSYWRRTGEYIAFLELPTERTAADTKRELHDYGCFLPKLEGQHLLWLLADPCTYALEHGLFGQKLGETEADRVAKVARRKAREQLAAEEVEAKRRGRKGR